MAERRMFSKRIISSAKFIKIPLTTQALYFHLGLNADDDGIVEAYSVIKTIGCNEDDLKVLVTKGFVTVLNEDLVSYILDWNENNKIRPDRKIDSIYQGLLLSINPNVEIVKKRQRADIKSKVEDMDGQWTGNGRTMDGIGKDRLGKDRLGKDSNNICADAQNPTPKTVKRFIPPTIEEVQAYCKEHNKPIDVEAFIGYYGSQGWKKANGQKLSSWELAVSQWYRRDCESGKAKKPETSYDIGQIEQSSFDLYKDLK